MNTQWVAGFVGRKHKHRVSNKALAEKMGVSENWVCEVLGYKRQAKDSKEKFETALNEIIEEKRREGV